MAIDGGVSVAEVSVLCLRRSSGTEVDGRIEEEEAERMELRVQANFFR
jgi:hypothetical protein